MKKICRSYPVLSIAIVLFVARICAADDRALIDALVRKGILSGNEAEHIQAEIYGPTDQSALGKIQIGNWVKEFKLYSDLRLRYQWDNFQFQVPSADVNRQQSRWRFRLRLNADFILAGNFFGAVTLQTNQASDSTTQTYTGGYDNYSIFINRAYMGWRPMDSLTFVAGKQPNPFYTTDMVWESAISPQGLVERVDFHKMFNLRIGDPDLHSISDSKASTVSPRKPRSSIELSLIAAQFLFYDNNEDLPGGSQNTDAYQFEQQLLFKYKFSDTTVLTLAPGTMIFNSANVGTNGVALLNGNAFSNATIPNVGSTGIVRAPVVGETKDELLGLLPGDFSFNLGKIPVKIYWDISYNFEGADRFGNYGTIATRVLPNGTILPSNRLIKRPIGIYGDIVNRNGQLWHSSLSDRLAYRIGFQIGDNIHAGDMSIYADWRQQGLVSLDPNLPNSDFGGKRLNMQGFQFGATYNIKDFLTLNLNVFLAWNMTGDLYQRGYEAVNGQIRPILQNIPVADKNVAQTIHLNLLMKF